MGVSGLFGWRISALLAALILATAPGFAEGLSLTGIVRQTMALYFDKNAGSSVNMPSYASLGKRFASSKSRQGPAGVFVTLSRDGQTRACWGSVYPQRLNIAEATMDATLGALTREYRYRPISASEWRLLKPQVTVVRALEQADAPGGTPRGLNPLRDGLLIRSGGKSGVILPGEARDATYQLVLARLKAGIGPHEPFQLYRIVADVYR